MTTVVTCPRCGTAYPDRPLIGEHLCDGCGTGFTTNEHCIFEPVAGIWRSDGVWDYALGDVVENSKALTADKAPEGDPGGDPEGRLHYRKGRRYRVSPAIAGQLATMTVTATLHGRKCQVNLARCLTTEVVVENVRAPEPRKQFGPASAKEEIAELRERLERLEAS